MALIGVVEQGFARILARDPNAILNEELLGVPFAEQERARLLLLELVKLEALKLLFLWRCPTGPGTTWEAEDLRSFPDSVVDCDRCHGQHWLSKDDVEVHFVASPAFSDAFRLLRT